MRYSTPRIENRLLFKLCFNCVYTVQSFTTVHALFFCSFVSGANDRNRLSEAAILEMTPLPGEQRAVDLIFCTFEHDDDNDFWF